METVTINKQAIADLVKVKEDFDAIVESIELMGNKEFMDSYKKAKEQIKKRDFDDWNTL
ncbi:MAG TPA: PIN domain-containing protein [Candidatus Nanoarchaeia archaeon]|nr:PIN domain-containing protein [Candidatus Nanoarchaeia archaeon]